MRIRFFLIPLVIWFYFACTTDNVFETEEYIGNVYYVCQKNGNDKNSGSESKPWKTINKAASILKPGQKVIVKAGRYKEIVKPKYSGMIDDYITYEANPGDDVIIDGSFMDQNRNFKDAVFKIDSKKYIIVSGFKVVNSAGSGIFAINSENIIIKNNSTENTWSSGISAFFCKNILIDNNLVVLACNDGNQECISVAGVDGFEIRNNHVRDGGPGIIGGEGIDAKDGSRNGTIHNNLVHDVNRLGIYVDSWAHHTYNIEVYNNVVYNNNAWGICLAAENGGLLEDIRVFNNIVYDNVYVGIGIEGDENWGVPGASHPFKNINIYNNTVHNNGSNYWGLGIRINCKDADGVYIRNNIFTSNESNQILIEDNGLPNNLIIENNLIYGVDTINSNISAVESAFLGKNSVILSPQTTGLDEIYKNHSELDFRLAQDSMAIDNGTDAKYPFKDFDGNNRTELIDIGAFEFQ